MIFTALLVSLYMNWGSAIESPITPFVYKSDPACMFSFTEFKNWKSQYYDALTLRYLPSETLGVTFEVPPAIQIAPFDTVKASEVQFKANATANPQGVSVRPVFIKGRERQGYLFEQGGNRIYVLSPFDESDHGLPARDIGELVRSTFQFLDKTALTDAQVRAIVDASPYREKLHSAAKASGNSVALEINRQPERYVISLKGFRGGLLLHLSKKDLSLTSAPGR